MMSDPSFTLEHEEQRWLGSVQQGDTEYTVRLTRYGTGKITIVPCDHSDDDLRFLFCQSDPNTVLAIGRLLVAAARNAGADAA